LFSAYYTKKYFIEIKYNILFKNPGEANEEKISYIWVIGLFGYNFFKCSPAKF
jgi:hypothetical protein